MFRKLLYFLALSSVIHPQDASLPLESVSVEGSAQPAQTVLEIAGFHVGAAVGKAAIEAACVKLQESGIFQSINYRYAPGPKHGYAVTLTLADQTALSEAAIDIPGVAENEVWEWLKSKYPAYSHKVPSVPAAEDFLARQIQQHVGAALDGQHLVARLETDFGPPQRLIISFQPESLPRITSMSFNGQHEMNSSQLVSILEKVAAGEGYTDRHFRQYVELNLRHAYEEHGMYRARFPTITSQKAGSSIAVATAIEEGPKFTLGEVQLVGEDLPADAMLAAAKFKKGETAN